MRRKSRIHKPKNGISQRRAPRSWSSRFSVPVRRDEPKVEIHAWFLQSAAICKYAHPGFSLERRLTAFVCGSINETQIKDQFGGHYEHTTYSS
jgi:hypothetical protein